MQSLESKPRRPRGVDRAVGERRSLSCGWRQRRRWPAIVASVSVALLASVAASSAAHGRVSAGFFGVTPQAPLSERDFARMQGTVGTLRVPFLWAEAAPQRGSWSFAPFDEIVGPAARHGIQVLPTLGAPPPWVSPDPARPPLARPDLSAWLAFVRRLARRYGPRGTFWEGRARRLPIRRWQIWNEPNFLLFWHPRPSPEAYMRLLRPTARAIRALDRHAVVLAAGVAPVDGGMNPFEFLRRMYAVPGAERWFDVVALHPYSSTALGVEYEVRQVRRVMAAAGDARAPLQLTEIGVASAARSPTTYAKGLRGQARYVTRVLGMLASRQRRWRIAGVDWFSWQDGVAEDPHCAFCEFAGLVRSDGRPKPAWKALRRLARRTRLWP
jgi:polysaccharide biosynthesis protein PslG